MAEAARARRAEAEALEKVHEAERLQREAVEARQWEAQKCRDANVDAAKCREMHLAAMRDLDDCRMLEQQARSEKAELAVAAKTASAALTEALAARDTITAEVTKMRRETHEAKDRMEEAERARRAENELRREAEKALKFAESEVATHRQAVLVAAKEADPQSRVGYEYYGSQTGTYMQWPGVQWCPSSYDPRFRPWRA